MSDTLVRPSRPGPDRSAWRRDRRPVIVAVVLVAVVLGGCWGLRWWGPINPAVSADVAPLTGKGVAPNIEVLVTNDSVADVEVVSAEHRAFSNPDLAVSGLAEGSTFPVVPGRGAARFVVGPPTCPPGVTEGSSIYDLVVSVRTASGRIMPVEARSAGTVKCRIPLPAPGPQPADPDARDDVESAFLRVYNGAADDPGRLELIDDSRGVAETRAAAGAGQFGGTIDQTKLAVIDVAFDRPDHAWVAYVLTNEPERQRRGEAVSVGGTWKVVRSTVCADLALASAWCPD